MTNGVRARGDFEHGYDHSRAVSIAFLWDRIRTGVDPSAAIAELAGMDAERLIRWELDEEHSRNLWERVALAAVPVAKDADEIALIADEIVAAWRKRFVANPVKP